MKSACSTEMVGVALLITTCILGYFVMKICLAVIKAGERAIGIVQGPGRNTGEQRDQRVEPRPANSSREVRGINISRPHTLERVRKTGWQFKLKTLSQFNL